MRVGDIWLNIGWRVAVTMVVRMTIGRALRHAGRSPKGGAEGSSIAVSLIRIITTLPVAI